MNRRFNLLPKLVAVILFAGAAATAQAQTADHSVWSSTKGVQKIANKQLFDDAGIQGSHIHAIAVSPTWYISKGIVSVNRTADVNKANIVGGSSDWQISKGVQKIQRRKAN